MSEAPPPGDPSRPDSRPAKVSTPVREIATPSRDLSALDTDVRVRNTGGRGFEYEVTLWNLNRETWQHLLSENHLTINLGWENGPVAPVADGRIDTTSVNSSGSDTAYVIRGRDITMQRLQTRRTATWQGVTLSRIVTDLAAACNLTTGVVPSDTPDVRFDHWTVSPERRITYWFDQLVAEAERRTDREWEWFAEGGAVSVVPRRQTTTPVIELDRTNSLLVFEPATSTDANADPDAPAAAPAESGGFSREFVAYLEPHIGRDRRIRVVSPDTDEDAPLYRVTSYTFESGSTSGSHHVRGTMVPQPVTGDGGGADA